MEQVIDVGEHLAKCKPHLMGIIDGAVKDYWNEIRRRVRRSSARLHDALGPAMQRRALARRLGLAAWPRIAAKDLVVRPA